MLIPNSKTWNIMKTTTFLFALLICALVGTPVRAATNFVILGDDFQSKYTRTARNQYGITSHW